MDNVDPRSRPLHDSRTSSSNETRTQHSCKWNLLLTNRSNNRSPQHSAPPGLRSIASVSDVVDTKPHSYCKLLKRSGIPQPRSCVRRQGRHILHNVRCDLSKRIYTHNSSLEASLAWCTSAELHAVHSLVFGRKQRGHPVGTRCQREPGCAHFLKMIKKSRTRVG